MPEQRIWVEVVRFLATNGLPFRGHEEVSDFQNENVSGGIYLNTFSKYFTLITTKIIAQGSREARQFDMGMLNEDDINEGYACIVRIFLA